MKGTLGISGRANRIPPRAGRIKRRTGPDKTNRWVNLTRTTCPREDKIPAARKVDQASKADSVNQVDPTSRADQTNKVHRANRTKIATGVRRNNNGTGNRSRQINSLDNDKALLDGAPFFVMPG